MIQLSNENCIILLLTMWYMNQMNNHLRFTKYGENGLSVVKVGQWTCDIMIDNRIIEQQNTVIKLKLYIREFI